MKCLSKKKKSAATVPILTNRYGSNKQSAGHLSLTCTIKSVYARQAKGEMTSTPFKVGSNEWITQMNEWVQAKVSEMVFKCIRYVPV